MTRPVWVEVNHQAIRENYRKIRNYVHPGASIYGVVKADAYGRGAVEVAHTLVQQGIDRLAVAMPEEAAPLRKSGLTLPIHVFGEVLPQQYPLLVQLRLTQTVGSAETLQLLSDFAISCDSEISIHLKCDTGMGRLGPLPEETADFVQYARNLPGLRLEGLMTHLARGDEQDGQYSRFQWNAFQEIMQDLHQRGIRLPLYHIANSPGLCLFPEMHLDMVRPGIVLYGMLPSLSLAPPVSTPARPLLESQNREPEDPAREARRQLQLRYHLLHFFEGSRAPCPL